MGPSELSLDCGFYSALKASPIGEFGMEDKTAHSSSERIAKLEDYAERLQAEVKKIEAYKRELPLCMLLVSDAIARVKDELTQCKKSNAMPVLEEFMPLNGSTDEGYENIKTSKEEEVNSGDKMNWMSSVQLWTSDNQHDRNRQTSKPNNLRGLEEEINRPVTKNLFRNGRKGAEVAAFLPYKGCTSFPVMKLEKEDKHELPLVPGLLFRNPEIKSPAEEINSSDFGSKSIGSRSGSDSATDDNSKFRAGQHSQQSSRKQRRCWSPELHRRFVGALEQLGGAQAATPKQIRELMQVDGLSNDEVKSHLQKYRIHTRRVASTTSTSANPPVLLGGLWMPQEHTGESSKQRDSQSGSPQGPTHLAGGDSSEDDDDDKKSDSPSQKHPIQLSI